MITRLPDLIDNETYRLAEALDLLLRTQPRADIASGYFNLGGYALVREALWQTPRVRLLLSKVATDLGPELYPAGFIQELTRMEYSAKNRELARDLAELLRHPHVEVRLYTRGFFHGKAYIFDNVAIVGSSNFTQAGLTGNAELNSVHKQDSAVQAVREWFERLWSRSEDYKAELIRLLEESKLISATYSPYLILMKSLYEYFKDELTLDLEKGRDVGRSLVELTNFQQKAFERALRILDKYGGVIIADSVGLGKTWIGKKLLEHFGYFERRKCLVVVPAQLESMWERELSEIRVAAKVETMEKMGRSDFQPDPYFDFEVVLIDESHNFRNVNNRYANLSRILGAGRRKKVILLTATPISNSVFDLYNQIRLFAPGDDHFARAGIPYLRKYFVQASRDGDLLNLLEEVMIRRTRQFIKQAFPDAVIDGVRVRFPKRVLHTERYDLEALRPGVYREVARAFEDLTLAIYNPEAFLYRPSEQQEQKRQRNEALIGLIKSLLLKRFESSVAAFRSSLDRLIAVHEKALEDLRQGSAQFAGDYAFLLEDSEAGEAGANFSVGVPPSEGVSAYRMEELAGAIGRDLAWLRKMRELVEVVTPENDPKLARLVELISTRRGKKILIFSHFRDTIRYISEAFSGPYAPALEGIRWAVVDGSLSSRERLELIQRFAPVAQGVQIRPDQHLDVLLATDALSEGQNLQDADTLINVDLHWNPTRMVQRAGRIDRLTSPFEEVHIHNFFPEHGLEEMLGLVQRLVEKIIQIDKNVGLDASILGEVVNPKTFNALQRIEAEDHSITDELEREMEISSEFMRAALSAFLQKVGAKRLDSIPYGVHSGMQGKDRKGVFFHFKVGEEHFWRFYDVDENVILDSKLRIYRLIQCEESTPRADGEYDIDDILNKVKKALLDDLNGQRLLRLQELPKSHKEILRKLRSLSRHPQVDKARLEKVLRALNRPLSPTLLRDLQKAFESSSTDGQRLVEALEGFVEKYRLGQGNGDEARPFGAMTPIKEEDLELVVYMTLT